MKAERVEPKQEFVPVIVTLESQAEVDALFAVVNYGKITDVLPAIDRWWSKLAPFKSKNYCSLWDKLDQRLK